MTNPSLIARHYGRAGGRHVAASELSTSADCSATLSCLQQLGVRIEPTGKDVLIDGSGADGLRSPETAT